MDEMPKPTNLESYKSWLAKESRIPIDRKLELYYERETLVIKKQFEESDYWQKFIGSFSEIDAKYYIQSKGYHLFLEAPKNYKPEIKPKPFNSVIDKTYRKNVLFNSNYPKEPVDGWVFPNNWFLKLNDIIRTSIVVKYLDGVDFLVKEFVEICRKFDKECKISKEARWEGYYAIHLSIPHRVLIAANDLETSSECDICVEIQITTQLQDVIKQLLHKYYEEKRSQWSAEPDAGENWIWDWRSDEFATNYLGHILHYIEGMIMDIRERQREEVEDET